MDKGYAQQYDRRSPGDEGDERLYGKWRDYDPEDTVRFYALRMNEVGMIKSSPQKIISQGTDWRFLRELKEGVEGMSISDFRFWIVGFGKRLRKMASGETGKSCVKKLHESILIR